MSHRPLYAAPDRAFGLPHRAKGLKSACVSPSRVETQQVKVRRLALADADHVAQEWPGHLRTVNWKPLAFEVCAYVADSTSLEARATKDGASPAYVPCGPYLFGYLWVWQIPACARRASSWFCVCSSVLDSLLLWVLTC